MGRFNISSDAECQSSINTTTGISRPSTPTHSVNPTAPAVDPIAFFSFVKADGYPEEDENEAAIAKDQPWRHVFDGPVPSRDGKLLIACPKGADWGSGSGLGGY